MNERLRQFAEGAAKAAINATRGNYFNNKERGELHELREELNSDVSLVRREGVRKVIAGMTVGEDMSALFPDILKCLQSKDLETKRLVYLYVINHAHYDPEMSLLSVNTFVRDSESKSALIRMLALRTMGSLQLSNIVDYIDEPLRRALVDDKAMVRRTAAICIGKLYFVCREYFDDMELAVSLRQLLLDPDPSVVSSALNVYEMCKDIPLEVNPELVARLSKRINNADEWSLSAILNIFSQFCDQCSQEQGVIILKHCSPLLSNANPAVIMATARVVINYIHRFPDLIANFDRRLSGCFTTLLTSSNNYPKELQYAVLKMLDGLVRQFPSVSPPLRSLFVYFNDPLYVRTAKLSLMTCLATRDNILEILSELSEYAKDVNVSFAISTINTLGTLAGRFSAIDQNVRRCIMQMLIDVCRLELGHLMQAAVVSLRSVYDPVLDYNLDIAGTLFASFINDPGLLESPESRAALLWLACHGSNYASAIHVVKKFSFQEEALSVQFELMESCFYLFCKLKESEYGDDVDDLEVVLKDTLDKAEKSTASVDLNERALLFRKLMEAGFHGVHDSSHHHQMMIRRCSSFSHFDDWYLKELGRLSTIYHEPVASSQHDDADDMQAKTQETEPNQAVDHDRRRDYLTEYL